LGRMEMRSASWASQATEFMKRSRLPWKLSSVLVAKSLSPNTATRPSFFGAASSGEGEAVGATDGDGEGDGVADTVTVATAPRLMGPFLSLPSSNCTGAFRVRSVSAQEAGEVFTRSCAKTPSMVPVLACTRRAWWKAVMTRKPRVISWYG